MKSKLYIIASILAVLCLICSCGGGSGSDSENAQKTVAVSFAVNTDAASRAISATSTDLLSTAKYQYKAIANWTSEFGTPQGTKTEWTDFTVNASKVGSIGYFAVGSWTFHVRVMDAEKAITLYETAQAGVTAYVNSAVTVNNPIEVAVTKKTDGKGTINFGDYADDGTYTLSAPACGASEKLVVTYGEVGSDAIGSPLELSKGATAAGFTAFKGQIANVNAGVYWVTITRNDGTSNVGSSTTMVEIYSGKTETVEGTVQAGVWVESFLAIKGIKTIEGTISADKNYVVKNTSVVFTITGTVKENGLATADSVTYYFCVNGTRTPITLTEGKYTWDTSSVDYGDYEISLIVSDANGTISASAPTHILVTVSDHPLP